MSGINSARQGSLLAPSSFPSSDVTRQSFASDVEYATNPMNLIRENAANQKNFIDRTIIMLADLPQNQILSYLEKHPETKALI